MSTKEHNGEGAPAAPDLHFYDQAISFSLRAIEAQALKEALMWAQQADLIGSEVDPPKDTSAVTRAYARIMLEACLRSQELALTTGNVLPEHSELAQVISSTSDRLAAKLQRLNAPTKLVALMAQGYAHKHHLSFAPASTTEPVLVSAPDPLGGAPVVRAEKRLYGAEKAENLEKMLKQLCHIERCAVILCGPDAPPPPLDRKLSVAKVALSNARHSLVRFFSASLSDWSMAKFFCKNTYTLLTARPISQAPAPSNNRELDQALEQLPDAYDALNRRSYSESAQHLDKALEQLENIQRS